MNYLKYLFMIISLIALYNCAPMNAKLLDEPYDLLLKNRTIEAKNVTVTITYSITKKEKYRLKPWEDKTIQILYDRYLICFDPDGREEALDWEWCEWYGGWHNPLVKEIEIICHQIDPDSGSSGFNPLDPNFLRIILPLL